MSAFTCRNCGAGTNRLIYPVGYEDHRCPSCYVERRVDLNCNLHQTADAWVGPKGEKHRMTTGKQWEIDNRKLADDKVTVINRVTGKETEF